MLFFYVDEYGDDSMAVEAGVTPARLKAGVSEHLVLAAVGIRDTSRKPLAEAMRALKQRHFGAAEAGPWSDSEIKGRYLFRVARSAATGHLLQDPAAYAALDTVDKVAALHADLARVFSIFRPMIFAVAVDKNAVLRLKGRRKKTPPLGVAYTYLSQRVALTMERLHAGESAILVADQQTQHERFFRSGEMNDVRDRMTKPLPMKPNFNLVMDKPLWIDTALSVWDREILQLPDIVAYSVARCMQVGAAPPEPCYLWGEIRRHLAVQWTTGDIESGGFAIYPKPSTFPQI